MLLVDSLNFQFFSVNACASFLYRIHFFFWRKKCWKQIFAKTNYIPKIQVFPWWVALVLEYYMLRIWEFVHFVLFHGCMIVHLLLSHVFASVAGFVYMWKLSWCIYVLIHCQILMVLFFVSFFFSSSSTKLTFYSTFFNLVLTVLADFLGFFSLHFFCPFSFLTY